MKKGFTLIELLAVIVVLGILGLIEGFIDTDINNPKVNKSFGKCLKINITKVAGTENYTYKVDESTVDNDSGC